METLKKICKAMLFPHPVPAIFLLLVSAAGLIASLAGPLRDTYWAYVFYAVSAYTLTVVCLFFTLRFKDYRQRVKAWLLARPMGEKFWTDPDFRTRVGLYASLLINLSDAIFKLSVGLWLPSLWWTSVAIYAMLLSLVRFFLLRGIRAGETTVAAYRRCRFCGGLLLLLTLALGGMITQMVLRGRGYSYPGLLIFAVAAYTFYSVTVSALDAIRYRKSRDPNLFAARAIRVAAALVSLLLLETAMLNAFGEEGGDFTAMIAATGLCIFLMIMALSLYLMIHAQRALKTFPLNENEKE